MKTSDLSSFDSIPYFTTEAVKQLLGEAPNVTGNIPTALYRWMKDGYLIQLKKGVYMTRRFYESHLADADFTPMVSAILIPQSYLSMEFILQRNGILTEITYPITAVTLKQTRVFKNQLGTFTYRNIKENLYGGFTISDYMGIPISYATVGKALFDYLYYRPWKGQNRDSGYDLAEDLRLNLDDFPEDNQNVFAGLVESTQSRKMKQILNNLRKMAWQH